MNIQLGAQAVSRVLGVVVQLAMAFLIWQGWWNDTEGARNVVTFAAWALGIMAMLVAFNAPSYKQGAAAPPSHGALRFVRDMVDVSMLGALVWVGAWGAAIGLALLVLGGFVYRDAVKLERERRAAEAPAPSHENGA